MDNIDNPATMYIPSTSIQQAYSNKIANLEIELQYYKKENNELYTKYINSLEKLQQQNVILKKWVSELLSCLDINSEL